MKIQTINKIFRHIIKVPNYPFLAILAFSILIDMYLNMPTVEWHAQIEDDNTREEIKEFMKKAYPKPLEIFIALSFYVLLFINL